MDEHDYISLTLYYARTKFYHLMKKTALSGLTKHPESSMLRLLNGLSLILGNCIQEGIGELNSLKNEEDLSFATTLALIYAHKRCSVIDKEAIFSLEAKLKELRSKDNLRGLYYAAIFLFLSERLDKSYDYVEKALHLKSNYIPALTLKAWIELQQNKLNPSILEIFENALTLSKNIDASLGKVRFYKMTNETEKAISILNKLSVRFPELNIILIEKMEIQLSSYNWDDAFETALRIINLEPNNIFALRTKCLILICKEGNIKLGVQVLDQLLSVIENTELYNLKPLLQVCQLFSRISCRNMDILSITFKYIRKVIQSCPNNAEFITELGYQNILMGDYKEAAKYFRSATKVNDSSIYALCGLTLCQMAESGVNDQVCQQIEFLNEIRGINKIPLLLYMTGKISNTDKAVNCLIECYELHFDSLKNMFFGFEYLLNFDADFLIQVVNEFLVHSPVYTYSFNNTIVCDDKLHITFEYCLKILNAIVKGCPGLVTAVFLLAKVYFMCGEIGLATNTLNQILNNIDPAYSDAYLLMAQIYVQQKQFQKAMQSLDICLSHNFAIRGSSMYHLLIGIVKKNQQHLKEAQRCFTTAMSLIGVKSVEIVDLKINTTSNAKTVDRMNLPLSDKVTLFLEMIDTCIQLGQLDESDKFMQYAMEEFHNTPETGRLLITNAELALKRGNVNFSIEILNSIQPGQSYYVQAKTRLANIYLFQKKDRLAFIECFKVLANNKPKLKSFLMVGDAYMFIQEPDLAIKAYKKANALDPTDSIVSSKLGRAYVKTHQYSRAINYYSNAILNPDHAILKLDLAELYLKLKQYTKAELSLLEEVDERDTMTYDLSTLQLRTKRLLLLARIREKAGNLELALSTLKEAKENEYRVMREIDSGQKVKLQEQNAVLSKICVLMAEHSTKLQNNDDSILHYKEALKFCPEDPSILVALAHLYLQMNLMDQCRDLCSQILQIDSDNEAAFVMMADISFRNMDFQNASYHFSQLLFSQPTHWTALARLIEVSRRSGTLPQSYEFLQRAEQNCTHPIQNAGLNYCKGLKEWYSNNPNEALRYFNYARTDSEWGQQAIFNMIEICINPDVELPSENINLVDSVEVMNSRAMALRTAERLLNGLHLKQDNIQNEALYLSLLKNFLLLASRKKNAIEAALNDFIEIASKDQYKNSVGPILGIASAYVLLKQAQKAKSQLKRVAKNVWNFEEAEFLERSWLLLADLYIQSSKFDISRELLQRVLLHNKSCAKAYELSGLIAEKEQMYKVAASNYEKSWRINGKFKPQIGYKLAYCYMRSKQYESAVDVCQQVLEVCPDYLPIKKDIMDKSRNNMRT